MSKKKKRTNPLTRTIIVDLELSEALHRAMVHLMRSGYRTLQTNRSYCRAVYDIYTPMKSMYHVPTQLTINSWVDSDAYAILEITILPLLPLRRRALRIWSTELQELEDSVLYQTYDMSASQALAPVRHWWRLVL